MYAALRTATELLLKFLCGRKNINRLFSSARLDVYAMVYRLATCQSEPPKIAYDVRPNIKRAVPKYIFSNLVSF